MAEVAPVLTPLGVVIAAALTYLGVRVTARSAERRARQDAAASVREHEATAQDKLIDQLQEELAAHRAGAEARMTAQDERMNRLERYADGYRDHAHELRSHIWDQKPPPPPEWPDGLPR